MYNFNFQILGVKGLNVSPPPPPPLWKAYLIRCEWPGRNLEFELKYWSWKYYIFTIQQILISLYLGGARTSIIFISTWGFGISSCKTVRFCRNPTIYVWVWIKMECSQELCQDFSLGWAQIPFSEFW